jgi:hypothetical protein
MDNAKLRGICKVCGGTISRHLAPQGHKFEESNYRYTPGGKLVEIVRE